MDETTLDAIHRLLAEIAETKTKAKSAREQMADIMEQNDDYKALEEELKELAPKRAKAKEVLKSDSDYQKFAAELDELKFKLKDLAEILSHHLVTYYSETNATQIKDDQGEVRQVIISAKIGRAEADIAPQS